MFKKILTEKSIILLIILAFSLNILRVILFGKFSFIYILWNIFLAFIPFLISSILLYKKENNKLNQTFFILGSFVWIIFLPNAPYIITDLIHIGVVRSVPVLYDSILLFTSAWVGLLLCLNSIYHMEKIFLSKYSKKITDIIIIAILVLTSFGIYLGRFFRFNSWDIFTNPISFVGKLFNNLTYSTYHIESLIYTLLFFVFLYISYISWKSSTVR